MAFCSVNTSSFAEELDAAGELGNWEYDLDTYNHCIAVLQRYFTGNPSGLTERDARIYSHYLQTEHKRFVKLAEELAAGRRLRTEGGISQEYKGVNDQ